MASHPVASGLSSRPSIVVIGGGLAGSEAAWQAAARGAQVTLYEMRPVRMTAAHQSGRLGELVCSNSLGSNLATNALGLLKAELRTLGSFLLACADATALPAGDALAVGRDAFSQTVTHAIESHAGIDVVREEVDRLPGHGIVVLATGPLTSDCLAEQIARLAGREYLYFFDAMAPIVTRESIDMETAFRASRVRRRSGGDPIPQGGQVGSADYINCPLSRDEYYAFVEAVNRSEKADLRGFEKTEEARRYFEGCLPIEVLAARSPDALAFGPMRPVGIIDPRTGRRPFAVVQLRQDNIAGTLYNLVGFQTNLRWADQQRVLRMIPGLGHAEFVRLGQMHRNAYLDSPALLRPTLQSRVRPDLLFAGQITGTEGYVGAIAGGLLAGVNAVRIAQGLEPVELPRTTMIGALMHYITQAGTGSFQPMKANFGLLPELESRPRDRQQRHHAYSTRAMHDLGIVIPVLDLMTSQCYQAGRGSVK